MVKERLVDLRTLLTLKFDAFARNNGSYYRKFSHYCNVTKQDLSLERVDKVTDFFKWRTKNCVPKKSTLCAGHTVMSHLNQVIKLHPVRSNFFIYGNI